MSQQKINKKFFLLYYQTDRIGVTINPCPQGEAASSFKEKYGLENTKANCELVKGHYMMPNCSMVGLYGLREGRYK